MRSHRPAVHDLGGDQLNVTPDLSELRDFIRGRRAVLYGFMAQGAALELDGDVLRVIPSNDIYVRYLNDNRAMIAELATEHYGRPIEVQCGPSGASPSNGDQNENGAGRTPAHPRTNSHNGNGRGSTLPYAIAYARRGIGVFPVHDIEGDRQCSCGKLDCPSGGKHPRLKDWQTLATTDEDQLAHWWGDWPRANVGIKCGAGSNLTVLDVDGDEGRATLRTLELERGELPETPVAITGSGGAHYYFTFEEGLQNAVRFAPGLDIRTEGGLVVGVGSKTKRPYTWEAAFALGDDLKPARMPDWLASLIRAANAPAVGGARLMLPAQIPAGERNNWLYKLARSLKARGMSAAAIGLAVQSENSTRCSPPMSDDEVRQLVDHATTEPDQKGFVPAVQNSVVPEVSDGYADRMAVDAFEAYAAMVGEKREYSIEGLIRDGCTAVLSALIGSGKSTFAMNLARAWALGTPFLDRECRQSKTLVVVSPKEYEAWADTIGFWELKGLIYLVESTKAHFQKREEAVSWFDFQMRTFDCRTFVLDTLFDFFGMPPNNTGDANRIAMNEQTPLLQLVRERNYSGLVTGHAPKSEAKAIDPRDPEESFGGHTAWTAQHRMRMTIRRKSQGVNAFVTGRGGYGDKGILKEELLLFDEHTRLDSLGGLFSDHLGQAAMPSVIDTLREFGEPISMPKLIEAMGKGDKWVKAGVKAGRKAGLVGTDAIKGKRNSTYWLLEQVLETDTLL
jgi:hypothetical protein